MPAAKYVGIDGGYHNNIPARDLSADEYDALTDEQKELVKASALYEVKPEPMKHSAVKPAAPVKAEPVADAPVMAATAVKDDGKK